MTICEAIAAQEGFGPPRNRATRNNNPGDVSWGPFARAHGADALEAVPDGIHEVARFAHFPDAATGFAAMRELLHLHYAGQTIAQMLYHYAPPTENNTEQYIAYVCAKTGLTRDTVIDIHL